MNRSPARLVPWATLLVVFAQTACVDRTNAAALASREVGVARTGAADSTQKRAAETGVVAVTAADAAALKLEREQEPKRSRRDSVKLASMTRPDTTLDKLWPVKRHEPLPGAVLPANRIVAYYGNPLSTRMGVLGEFPKAKMFAMLDREVARWAEADPEHPVVPALHFIVTVAQGAPGRNGLYRLQMRDSLTDVVHAWAREKRGLLFLDVQPGKSTVQAEVPRLRAFLENPDVHLAIDPEFSMAPSGALPGKRVGTVDAKDINWAIAFLDEIVREKQLPPKVLIVHRYTRRMVTNARAIRPVPNVQVVMHMDGWGPPSQKFDTFNLFIRAEPVEFAGFKLFYKNNRKKGDPLLTPGELLRLNPQPLYIQYQ
jgi:hypothetical protein